MADSIVGNYGSIAASNVRDIRTGRGLSVAELSRRTGGSLAELAIRRIESGQRRIDVDDLFLLARALDTVPSVLLAQRGAALVNEDQGDGFTTAHEDWLEFERLVEFEKRVLRVIEETRPSDGEH